MSYQRRRSKVTVDIHLEEEIVDHRQNRVIVPSATRKITTQVAMIPDHSARAELAGEMDIDVYRMISDPDIEDFGLWSSVHWDGKWWDVVTTPQLHIGTRGTRHLTTYIRRRHDDGGHLG